jgi:hypothetical protein
VTADGRKLATHARTLSATDFAGSKLNVLAAAHNGR